MRLAILAFAMVSCRLFCPDCFPQANRAPSKTDSATTQTSVTEPSVPAVQFLVLKETIPLAYASPQGFMSGVKCDGDGNIFVPMPEMNSDGTVSRIVLIEIVPDSKSTKTFGSQPLPASDYPNQSIHYFDVDAHGTVYALGYTHEDKQASDKKPTIPQYFIERFNDDGSTDSVVRLGYPPGTGAVELDLSHFGIFGDGSFIVAGTQWDASTEAKPFTGIYGSNGKFIRSVALPDDVLDDETLKAERASSAQHDAAVSAITLGSMVSSPDGIVYLLRDSQPVRIYAVASSGEVVKRFQLSPPLPGLNVFSAGLAAKDSLLLYFAHPPPEHLDEKPVSQWLIGIFNSVSGQFDAVYKLPAKTTGVPACGDQHRGLLLVGNTADQHLAVFDYAP